MVQVSTGAHKQRKTLLREQGIELERAEATDIPTGLDAQGQINFNPHEILRELEAIEYNVVRLHFRVQLSVGEEHEIITGRQNFWLNQRALVLNRLQASISRQAEADYRTARHQSAQVRP